MPTNTIEHDIQSQVLALDTMLIPLASLGYVGASVFEEEEDDFTLPYGHFRMVFFILMPLFCFSCAFLVVLILFIMSLTPLLVGAAATMWILNSIFIAICLCIFCIGGGVAVLSDELDLEDIFSNGICREPLEQCGMIRSKEDQEESEGDLSDVREFSEVFFFMVLGTTFVFSLLWTLSVVYCVVFLNWAYFGADWTASQTAEFQLPTLTFWVTWTVPSFSIADLSLIGTARYAPEIEGAMAKYFPCCKVCCSAAALHTANKGAAGAVKAGTSGWSLKDFCTPASVEKKKASEAKPAAELA